MRRMLLTEVVRPAESVRGRLGALLLASELWVVGAAVAAGMVVTRALPFAVAGAAFYWLVRRAVTGVWTARTPNDWAIALLVLMLPMTLWASSDPATTLPQVWRLLGGVALYYAIVNWCSSPSRLRLVVLGATLVGLGLAVSAPFSVTVPPDKLPFVPNIVFTQSRILVSDPVNPNVMAGALVILVPCACALLLFAWRVQHWATRLALSISLLGMAVILVLTQSRGALLGLAASIALIVWLRWRFGWLLVCVPGLVAVAGLARVDPIALLGLLTPSRSLEGVESRPDIWARAIAMIQDHPFTGIGMGLFQGVADRFYPFMSASPEVPHAHQLLLQVAVDLGIPGLITWLAILFGVVGMSWTLWRRGRVDGDAWLAGLGAGLLAAQAALMMHGLVDAVTWGMVRTAVVIWAVWGIAGAAYRLSGPARPVEDL
jgi:putative inorganic carbon (hco3(-)) transporter